MVDDAELLDRRVDPLDAVALVDVDDDRAEAARILFRVVGVGQDEDDVAGMDQAGGGAVDAAFAAAACAGEGVGGEPVAVIDVQDVDLLVLDDVGGFQELRVEGDAAHIVEVSFGDRHSVNLAL